MKKSKAMFLGLISTTLTAIPILTLSAKKKDSKVLQQAQLKAYGYNGEGYVKVDSTGAKNFKLWFVDKNGNKKSNYKLNNGDIIRYSYTINGKKFNSTDDEKIDKSRFVIKGLKQNPKSLYDQYSSEISKTIFLGKNYTNRQNFKINKLVTMEDSIGEIYKVELLNNIQNYKKGFVFYVSKAIYKDTLMNPSVYSEKNEEGHASPSYWDYNDDDEFTTKIQLNFSKLKTNESYRISKIYNIFQPKFYNGEKIDKIQTNFRRVEEKYIDSNYSFDTLKDYSINTWFDHKGSFGVGTFFSGIWGGLTTILSAPTNLITGSLAALFTNDSDYLLTALDDITENNSGLSDNVSDEKKKIYQYASLGASIATAFIPGGSASYLTKALGKLSKFGKVASNSSKISKITKVIKNIKDATSKINRIISEINPGSASWKILAKIRSESKRIKEVEDDYNRLKGITSAGDLNKLSKKELENYIDDRGKYIVDKMGNFIQEYVQNSTNTLLSLNNFNEALDKKNNSNDSLKEVLTRRGFIFEPRYSYYPVTRWNDSIHETLKIYFNAHSKTFFSSTSVKMSLNKSETNVFTLGEKNVVNYMNLLSGVKNINKDIVSTFDLKVQKLFVTK